ncbi:hypothetical protein EMCRGX_G000084 [Ephydatia muelleri]
MPRVRAQKRVGLYACNCTKCKKKYRYSYSTVCRHRNIDGTEAGEAERDVYVPDTRESLQLNSNLDMDVTISSTANEQNSSGSDHDLFSVQDDFYVGTQECSGAERLSDACFEESATESSEPETDWSVHRMDSETDSDNLEISLGTEQNNSEGGTAVIDNSVEMEIQDANNHESDTS